MTNGIRRLVLALLLSYLGMSVQAQQNITPHTFKLAAGTKPPPATLADMAWLAGQWVGPAFGGEAEEIWSAPKAGSMMGMYRLVRGGKPIFYEFQTLVEQNGSLILRLKHFKPDLTGWEEKQKSIDFPLVNIKQGIVQFEGLSFHREGDAKLTIYLAIERKNGAVHEETFSYSRVQP